MQMVVLCGWQALRKTMHRPRQTKRHTVTGSIFIEREGEPQVLAVCLFTACQTKCMYIAYTYTVVPK